MQATLCSLPSPRGHLELPLPPALKVQQHMCDVSIQESPLKTQHPRVLQELVAGTLCLAFTKILDLQRESRQIIQHKPHFFAQSRHSELLLPVNCWLELMINPACCVYPFMHKAKAVLK